MKIERGYKFKVRDRTVVIVGLDSAFIPTIYLGDDGGLYTEKEIKEYEAIQEELS